MALSKPGFVYVHIFVTSNCKIKVPSVCVLCQSKKHIRPCRVFYCWWLREALVIESRKHFFLAFSSWGSATGCCHLGDLYNTSDTSLAKTKKNISTLKLWKLSDWILLVLSIVLILPVFLLYLSVTSTTEHLEFMTGAPSVLDGIEFWIISEPRLTNSIWVFPSLQKEISTSLYHSWMKSNTLFFSLLRTEKCK